MNPEIDSYEPRNCQLSSTITEALKKDGTSQRRTRVKRCDSAVERCKAIGDSLPEPKTSTTTSINPNRSDPYHSALSKKRGSSGNIDPSRSRRCKTADPELENPFGAQESYVELEQDSMDWEASSEGDQPQTDLIRLPAYLPLPHRRPDKDLLDSAFTNKNLIQTSNESASNNESWTSTFDSKICEKERKRPAP